MGFARPAGGVVMDDFEIDAADPIERCRRGWEALGLDDDSARPKAALTPARLRLRAPPPAPR